MSDSQADIKYKVHFLPDDILITVNKGTSLLASALAAGVHINASCDGKGKCRTCKIKISSGMVENRQREKLSPEENDQGIRLACQSLVLSDLIVTIPPGSRLDKAVLAEEQKKSAGACATGWKYSPPLQKYYLELPPATARDNANDLFRLMWGLKQSYDLLDLPINFDVIRKLPSALRENNWNMTATTTIVSSRPQAKMKIIPKIINVEPGDTRSRLYALAVDIGTTAVCAQIVDLNRGKIAAGAITLNQQITSGEDIFSRISFSQKSGGLKKLQEAVVDSINTVLEDMLGQSGIDRKDICHMAVAGNPTMQHILLGLDPAYIRLSPHTPNANFIPSVKASSLGINLEEHVYIFAFPAISGFVGGDTIAGITACGMHQAKRLTLYIDIGTNGEIVIGNSEWMVAASCLAGAAFEGHGTTNGMLAAKGAIQDTSLDPVTYEPKNVIIGGEKPLGICGAGFISAISELLKHRVIDRNGKFNTALSSSRIRKGEKGFEYVLSWAADSAAGKDIVITEPDINGIIRAKASIYAGFQTLVHSQNLNPSDFQQVIIAGNLGESLNIEKAVNIGLLPDLPEDRFVFVGNAALSGARLVNYSSDLLNASRRIAQIMTNIELSDNSDYNNYYVPALQLSHTDEKGFSSMTKKPRAGNKARRSPKMG